MSNREQVTLKPGFAYCEAYTVFDKTMDLKPMVDKNGCPMICISWKVVDSDANIGYINSYISSKLITIISNLQNALGVNNLFDGKRFNTSNLKGMNCGAVIKESDKSKSGYEIAQYVPLRFFEMSVEGNRAKQEFFVDNRKPPSEKYAENKRKQFQDVRNDEPMSSDDDIPF